MPGRKTGETEHTSTITSESSVLLAFNGANQINWVCPN